MSNHEINSVRQLVQLYFDVVYRGDLDAFDAAFASHCQLQTIADGNLKILSLAEYRELVQSRQLAHPEKDGTIEDIHLSAERIGYARVRVQIGDRFFSDYLCVMKLADGWKIVAKIFVPD